MKDKLKDQSKRAQSKGKFPSNKNSVKFGTAENIKSKRLKTEPKKYLSEYTVNSKGSSCRKKEKGRSSFRYKLKPKRIVTESSNIEKKRVIYRNKYEILVEKH